MLKGFKEFVVRGNVVDLAVGFVLGTAFAGVVTQFTVSFLDPLVRLIFGGEAASGTWTVRDVVFDWAAFVNVLVAFLATAAVLYFLVVLPMNRLAQRRRRGQEPAAEEQSDEVRLLTEIRDALAARR